MSIEMDKAADAILQAAREKASLDELHQVEAGGDRDGSSSLSDIEDKDGEQDEDSDDIDSDEEGDSEAETERLEESPNKFRPHQDVVLSSHNGTSERSPSKLQNQIAAAELDQEMEDDDGPLSDDLSDNGSVESPKSSAHDDPEIEPTTAATSLEDSSGEGKRLLSVIDADTRKRKRSIMAGSGLDDLEEPLRKRTGTIMAPGEDYVVEEDDEIDVSHPVSGNISGDEAGENAQEDDVPDEVDEPANVENDAPEAGDLPISPKKRGRKKKKVVENGVNSHDDDTELVMDGETALNGEEERGIAEEENAENEGDDEAEAALKNEEELEKKRVALDQLGDIEKQFTTFRERLYEERLEALNQEEAMLQMETSTHPGYIAMLKCVEARWIERFRVAEKIREYERQALMNRAVARRSQILVQYRQEVREIREAKLEQLGKQWYEIQHDRRSYAGSVPDYTLKFPTRRSQQVMNQVAYSTEVSILSGVAKYVGFPAAPPMASSTPAELEEDLKKMGRTKQALQPAPAALPLQELGALRTAGNISRFKPAEEQFIEQTPWANPQHPSHVHLLQRQASAQQIPRTISPFSQAQNQPRRHSQQHGSGGPVSGTFSNSSSSLLHHSNGAGRTSPHNHNPFGNSNNAHAIAPSPLGSRQTSLSPQDNRVAIPDGQRNIPNQDVPKSNGVQHSPPVSVPEVSRDYPHELRREQAAAMMSRF